MGLRLEYKEVIGVVYGVRFIFGKIFSVRECCLRLLFFGELYGVRERCVRLLFFGDLGGLVERRVRFNGGSSEIFDLRILDFVEEYKRLPGLYIKYILE